MELHVYTKEFKFLILFSAIHLYFLFCATLIRSTDKFTPADRAGPAGKAFFNA